MARAAWGSRLGFILAAAGSAIGLGAIWKFPYVTARNGGGSFLLLFLVMVFTLGFAVMIAEMAAGQIARKGPVGAYRRFGGRRWVLAGYAGIVCGFLILSFYSVVGGWTLFYVVKSAGGGLVTPDAEALKAVFDTFVSHPMEPVGYHALFMALTAGVVLGGVQKGIERVSKWLMTMLFLLILVLIARSLTLPGAWEGVVYFLKPDFSRMSAEMVLEAMGLAFFSLSLGMGCMMTYGSYVSDETDIASSAAWIIGLTTAVCFLVGLMILPAVFVFGLNPAEGSGLTFIIMPAVFSHLAGGGFFAVLFFFLLFVAALTSSVSLMEVVVSFLMDEFGFSRPVSAALMAVLMFVLGIAASLSFGVWKAPVFFGMNLFGFLDYVTSHVMMPFGGIMVCLLAGWVAWEAVAARLLAAGTFSPRWLGLLRPFCRYVAPLLILMVLLQNL
ncbi:MAG: sodium-dependent transporter [Alistipes senegalensis]|nr:sodium-dependent transporter [Oxalobacter formigenes]MCM1280358.1 sodium-dependent transporter [Alistipes senegalensis]